MLTIHIQHYTQHQLKPSEWWGLLSFELMKLVAQRTFKVECGGVPVASPSLSLDSNQITSVYIVWSSFLLDQRLLNAALPWVIIAP